MDSKIVQVALNGLENILRLGELEAKRGGGINPYCALIEEAYGMLGITLACDIFQFFELRRMTHPRELCKLTENQ